MEFLYFLVYSLLYVSCLIVPTSACPGEDDKYKKLLIDKKLPSVLATFTEISPMFCSYECSKNNDCKGFAYNPSSKVCKHSEHSPFLVQELVDDDAGFELFNDEDLRCRLDFTAHMAGPAPRTFTSPSYPSNYPDNVNQFWLIVKPSKTSTLRVRFDSFNTQFTVGCIKDILMFYKGYCTDDPYLLTMCGYAPANQLPVLTEATSLYVLVQFVTDSSNDVSYSGFSLEYKIVS